MSSSSTPHNAPSAEYSGSVSDADEVTSVRSQIFEEELIRYLRWRSWGTLSGRTRQIRMLALTSVLGLAGGYALSRLLDTEPIMPMLMLGLLLPPVVALSLWRHARELARAYRKQAPQVYEPAVWTLRADGILVQSEAQSAVREWRSIREIHLTHELLVFELGQALAMVLPRRCFSTPAASQKFAAVARELWEGARNRVTDPPTPTDLDAALGTDRIEVRYDMTPRDLNWLFRHATWTFFRRRPLRFLGFGASVLFAAAMLALVASIRGGTTHALLVAGAGIAFVPAFLFGLRPYLHARQYARVPGMVGPHVVWTSERGMIGYTADTGIARMEWSAYSRLRQAGDYLVFERGEGVQGCISLRGQNPAVIDQILAWHAAALAAQPAEGARV